MRTNVLLKKSQHVTETDDPARKGWRIARQPTEDHHAQSIPFRCGDTSSAQELLDQLISFFHTAESPQDGSEHSRIADRRVDGGTPFLHLTDDQIDVIAADIEKRIRFFVATIIYSTSEIDQACGGKAEGENIDIGDRSKRAVGKCFDDGVLGGGEVTVELQIGLHQCYGVIHVAPPASDIARMAPAQPLQRYFELRLRT